MGSFAASMARVIIIQTDSNGYSVGFLITFIPMMRRTIQRNMFILMPAEAEQNISIKTL